MARVRVNRSDLGPMCTLGMIGGIGIAIYGVCNLFGDSMLYGNEAVMAIVVGVIFFVLSLIARIANAPFIDGKKQMNAQIAAARKASAPAAVTPPQDPKFLEVYKRLPHCADMEKLKLEAQKAENMVRYGGDYTFFFQSNPCREALLIVHHRFPHVAKRLVNEYYDKYIQVPKPQSTAALTPEQQKHRYVSSQLPTAQDFGGYLDGLKARGLTEEDLKKPEIALREFQQQPSKSFLLYLQLNAPESYQKVLDLYARK